MGLQPLLARGSGPIRGAGRQESEGRKSKELCTLSVAPLAFCRFRTFSNGSKLSDLALSRTGAVQAFSRQSAARAVNLALGVLGAALESVEDHHGTAWNAVGVVSQFPGLDSGQAEGPQICKDPTHLKNILGSRNTWYHSSVSSSEVCTDPWHLFNTF